MTLPIGGLVDSGLVPVLTDKTPRAIQGKMPIDSRIPDCTCLVYDERAYIAGGLSFVNSWD